jgi:hypothetical protein
MRKKSQPDNDVASPGGNSSWSIGSGRLSAKGEAELLRFYGSMMREGYEQIIEEPMPDRIQSLLVELGAPPPRGCYGPRCS